MIVVQVLQVLMVKTVIILVFFADSSVIPVSIIHLFANIMGEYQRPSKANALTAATIVASQFRF
jgi:hypothetical protein